MTTTQVTSHDEFAFASRIAGLRGSPIDDLDTLLAGRHQLIPLAGGTPHLDDLPVADLAQIANGVISESPDVLNYGLSLGDSQLREQLIELAAATGDGPPTSEELVVTSGAMQALDLIAKLFLDPGDVVLVESPTYSDALATFSAYEPRLVEAPADQHGLDVASIKRTIDRVGTPPKLIYVIPTFQNPAGTELPHERREALIELAEAYGSLIVDDDPYRLLRYYGDQLPSLRAMAGNRRHVVGVRSSSKLIAPGLRIGWTLGHPDVISQMVKAKQGMDTCTSNVNQRIVGRFIKEGLLESRLERLRDEYSRRLTAITDALYKYFADTDVTWTQPNGGYFLWVTLDRSRNATRLLRLAIEEGVSFVPGTAFSPSRRFENSLRLCFVADKEPELREAVRRLRSAYDTLSEEMR